MPWTEYPVMVATMGTGAAIRFPHSRQTRALTEARVALEIMVTVAQ